MDLPNKIKLIIEALRAGQPVDPSHPPNVRRNPDGSITRNPYGGPGPFSSQPYMPTGLRGYQLHNQEATATGDPTTTYADWIKDK